MAPITRAQRRLLKHIRIWGEIGPNAENDVGCSGAAFSLVIDALNRKGLIQIIGNDILLTETGVVALKPATKPEAA